MKRLIIAVAAAILLFAGASPAQHTRRHSQGTRHSAGSAHSGHSHGRSHSGHHASHRRSSK